MNPRREKWFEEKLARIASLESYSPEKTVETVAKQFGLLPAEIVKLNFNENLYMQRDKLVAMMREVADECDLRLYPQEEEENLRQAIGEYFKLPQACVTVGNSSDELMDRITRLFLERGERAVTFSPTFSVFRYCVKYYGADYVGVPLKNDFRIDIEAMRTAFTPSSKLLYLCSPNNPSGNQLDLEEVEALIEDFSGIVMVDEAYGEYADYSVIPLIEKYENLIVLRTFSKAFGLAGLRLGYALANARLAKAVSKIPAPYAINTVALTMGRKLLENIGIVMEAVNLLKIERGRLITALNEISGVEAFNSQANFILFNVRKSCEDVYLHLLKKGLIIKKLGRLLDYENCLRTAVGLPDMNTRLLNALGEYLGDEQ
jgi:histidinol-phosphate aminotransferase